MSRGSALWLALALLGMIVTFAIGLWIAQAAHPLPATPPPYDTDSQPTSSAAFPR